MVTVAFKAPAKSFDMDVERLRRSICHDLAPDTFHQLFSLDHLASSLKQKPQDEELFLREARQWFAIAEDDPGAEVELDALGAQEVPSSPRSVTARNQLSLKVRDQLAEVRCGRHHMTSCRRGDGVSPNSEPCPAAPIGENVRVRSESTMTASWCGSKWQLNFRNFAKLFATLLMALDVAQPPRRRLRCCAAAARRDGEQSRNIAGSARGERHIRGLMVAVGGNRASVSRRDCHPAGLW